MSEESSETRGKPSAGELLVLSLKDVRDKVDQLISIFKERVPRQLESSSSRAEELVHTMQPIVKSLKDSGDYINLNLSTISFKEIKNAIESLNKSVKDMEFEISGMDVKVKGMSDLLSSVVRNTRELSEDVKTNTALMNMLMKALETKSAERESMLLKNMQTSTELIQKFTALVKTQTENSSKTSE